MGGLGDFLNDIYLRISQCPNLLLKMFVCDKLPCIRVAVERI